MKTKNKLSKEDKLNLEYHEMCRSFAERLGAKLYGSSINAGCSVIFNDNGYIIEIPEIMMVNIEKIIDRAHDDDYDAGRQAACEECS